MANGLKTPQDEDYYNRTKSLYDRELHAAPTTAEQDQRDAFEKEFGGENYKKDGTSGDIGGNISDTKNQEENAPWKTSIGDRKASAYGGNQSSFGRQLSGANIRAILKKRGPLGLLITILLGGGLAGTLFLTPGLLMVQMKEVMMNKFNTQLSSMEIRFNKVVSYKVDSTTKGLCGDLITVKCKYSTMNETQVGKLKDAKITVIGDSVNGRMKPTSFEFKGKSISAQEFTTLSQTDPDLRNALKEAYNPRFYGFIDKVWKIVKAKFGLSKGPPKAAANDTERAANLDDETKNGMKESGSEVVKGAKKDPSCTGSDCATFTDEDVAAAEKANSAAAQLTEEANAAAKAGRQSGAIALNEVAEVGVETLAKEGPKSFTNFFKATGVADTGCQAYGAIQAVGYAAKTVRAVQLARYAMAFLRTADMIKDGTAKPEDVAYMGGILTEVAYDAKSAVKNTAKLGTATDSFGYKFAAYGDTGASAKSMNLASQFLVGGGLTGDLINFTNAVNAATGGAPKETCQFLGNPIVSAASLVGGVALLFVPGVNLLKVGGQIAGQATLTVGLMVLPELLKDIVAGVVANSSTKGEASGNAITSGSGVIMSELAGRGANAPLTPTQAVAYNELQNRTLAQYAEDDRHNLSPLDATSSNTFMGMVVAKLIPSLSKMSSLSGVLSSFSPLASASFASLIPSSHAISTEQYKQSLTMCTDPDYKNIDGKGTAVATDPFCNVIYGLPEKYLNKDPGLVIDELVTAGDLDPNTDQPTGKYVDFKKNCIDRSAPLGDTGTDQQQSSGAECFINDSNANYYLHAVDQRVNDGMSGDLGASDTPASTSAVNSGNVNPNGWTFPTTAGAQVVGAYGTPRGNNYHTGIDINVPAGSPFYATRDGVVEIRQYDVRTIVNDGGAWCTANGVNLAQIDPIQKDIWIKHEVDGQTYASVYGHLSSYVAKNGDHVKAGDLIGYTGGSGCSKGPHVHFEIWKGYPPIPGVMTAGRTLDPTPLIYNK